MEKTTSQEAETLRTLTAELSAWARARVIQAARRDETGRGGLAPMDIGGGRAVRRLDFRWRYVITERNLLTLKPRGIGSRQFKNWRRVRGSNPTPWASTANSVLRTGAFPG